MMRAKNDCKGNIIRTLCILLAICTGFIGITQLTAKAFEPTIYVDDVKIYLCDSGSGSPEKAKQYFESIGYVSTGIDLNVGTDTGKDAYLGYHTTTNKDMAITDIRLMAMDTGYQLYDYKQMVDYLASQKAGTAQTMYSASVVFIDNYNAGSPKAIDAYEGLNLFNIGDAANTKLGDYILSGAADVKFFTDMLVKSSAATLNAVHSFLSIALTPYENDIDEESGDIITTNWAEFTVRSEMWDLLENEEFSTDELEEMNRNYNDLARDLFKAIQDFVTLYENAKVTVAQQQQEDLPDAENINGAVESMDDVDREDTGFMYLAAYEMLNEYSFESGMKLGDWFLNIGKKTSDTVDLKQLYPVVEAMGDSQAAIVKTSGFVSAVMNLAENEHNEDLDEAVANTKTSLTEYVKTDSLSIWENCDGEIENKTIAFTSDSVRKSSAENAIGKKSKWQLKKELFEEIEKMLNLIVGILFVVIPVMKFVLTLAVVVTKLMAATCIAMAALNTFCVGLLAVATFLNACLPWIAGFVMLFTIGLMVGVMIKEAIMGREVDIDDYTDKPDFIFDAKDIGGEVIDIKYRSVLDNEGKIADINRSKQIKWCLLAYTTDTDAGSPICADKDGNIFKCVKGNSDFVNGYDCARYFGERTAGDCNAFCFENDVGGCYLHYRTEASINNENPTPPEPTPDGEKPNEEKSYIGDLLICTGANAAEAQAQIKRHEGKFYVLDYNLSPDMWFATYIGYSMTTNPSDAITDLRIAPYMGISQQSTNIYFGDIQYTRIDIVGDCVPAGSESAKPSSNVLYYTKDKNAGSPILADGLHPVTKYSDAQPGWEPIALFGNDVPYNFNTTLAQFTNSVDVVVGHIMNISPQITCYFSDEDHGLNKVRNVYLYYEPETTYTDGTKYLSGVFFYGGFEWEDTLLLIGDIICDMSEYTDRLKTLPNVILSDVNLYNSIYQEEHLSWLHMQAYIGFTYTYNPKRAIYNIEAYEGDSYSDSLNYTMAKVNDSGKSMNYVAASYFAQQPSNNLEYNLRFISPTNAFKNSKGLMIMTGADTTISLYNDIYDGYVKAESEGVKFGYSKMNVLPAGLYLTGYQEGVRPITLSDIVVSQNKYTAAENNGLLSVDVSSEKTLAGTTAAGAFHGVNDMKNPRSVNPYNLGMPDYYKDGKKAGSGKPLYIYLSGSKLANRKYISSLSIGTMSREQYKLTNEKASDDELKSIDKVVDANAMMGATVGCADEVKVFNLSLDNQGDAWYNRQKDGKANKEAPENKPASYIGVTRTDDAKKAITGVLLYKLDDKTAPGELTIDSIKYICAGVQAPIVMSGSKYYLYYTYNTGAIPGEPIEDIVADNIPIINGYATNLCADKTSDKPYGNSKQTNFIHVKYQRSKGDFYNKLYVGMGKTARAAQCDLLSQGCVEFIDLDVNTGCASQSVFIGYRTCHLDMDAIESKNTESGRKKELNSQLIEAVYDVIITDDEPYHSEGIVSNNIYYAPVSKNDLTAGYGHKLYMYYACQWNSSRYNKNNNAGTYLPQDVFTGFCKDFALSRYDRVPYNTSLEGTTETGTGYTPWEYVMYRDNSTHADLNKGLVSIKKDDDYTHYAQDIRVTMFVQRSDGSVKPAGEITGGFLSPTVDIGSIYVKN